MKSEGTNYPVFLLYDKHKKGVFKKDWKDQLHPPYPSPRCFMPDRYAKYENHGVKDENNKCNTLVDNTAFNML